MKKIITILMLLFSAFALNTAYAVENYTNTQDLGTGEIQIPQNQGKENMGGAVQSVSDNGMKVLNNVTERIAGDIDKKVKTQIQKYYVQVTAPLLDVFAGFIVLWIIFQGISMMTGRLLDMNQVFHHFVIMLMVWTLVFSWDAFYPYVAEVFLDDLPNLIGEMTGTDTVTTFQSFMSVVLNSIADAFQNVDTGITNPVSGFFFVLIYAGILGLACLVCGVFFLIWIISKMIVAILLVVAPIFLACAMFPASRRYATNWLQAIITPLVVILLMIIASDFVISTIVPIVQELNEAGSTFIGAFVMIIILFMVLGVFYLVPKLAISLVGSGFEASTSATSGVMQSFTSKLKGR